MDTDCSHKIAFASYQEAAGAAVVASWQYGSSLKPYQCQRCELWHLATVYDDDA